VEIAVRSETKLTKYTLQYECSVVEPASDLLTGKLSLQKFWDDKVTKPSLYGYQVCFLFICCSLRTHLYFARFVHTNKGHDLSWAFARNALACSIALPEKAEAVVAILQCTLFVGPWST
jgi:hypothetical protein